MPCGTVMVVGGRGICSPEVGGGIQGDEVWCPSDKVLFPTVVIGILEGRVALQGCICTLSKLCALGLIGVVCAFLPVQVVKHDEQEADQD